jgi:hypothetical protein
MPAFLSKQISARSYGITDKGGSMGPKRNKHPLLYFCWLDANSHSFLGMSCAHCCEDPMVTMKCRTAIKVLFLYLILCLKGQIG